MLTDPPLIVTLAIDEAAFLVLDGLRRRHFPPLRNLVPAHVTLFHRLPGSAEAAIRAELTAACRDRQPFALTGGQPRLLGRGVALAYVSPELQDLRGRLAASFLPLLSAQDRQSYRPHVTIQNKVAPDLARALALELESCPRQPTITATGLLLWRYLEGPWQPVAAFPFTGAAGAARFPPRPQHPTSGPGNGEPG
ncbi:2'-5' RNA ligase family protein [Geminicoccus flavidas]|uniref:2'-5' RNA ligase family protein n=1 Tax=Geminicoccus flavidas TaxID=2506407 RepID=UPI00135CF6C9|nr:2'-5' RNA ligase family protein [Geminicoccus flavidas]